MVYKAVRNAPYRIPMADKRESPVHEALITYNGPNIDAQIAPKLGIDRVKGYASDATKLAWVRFSSRKRPSTVRASLAALGLVVSDIFVPCYRIPLSATDTYKLIVAHAADGTYWELDISAPKPTNKASIEEARGRAAPSPRAGNGGGQDRARRVYARRGAPASQVDRWLSHLPFCS